MRTLATRPSRVAAAPVPGPARLRVEADGVTLVDLDQPVAGVRVTAGAGGLAQVEVRPSSVGAEAAPLRVRARTVTVSGADFRYRADAGGGEARTVTDMDGTAGGVGPHAAAVTRRRGVSGRPGRPGGGEGLRPGATRRRGV
ncbi:hypothetical protein SALBM135S_04972 [Streptomyces alboniger]